MIKPSTSYLSISVLFFFLLGSFTSVGQVIITSTASVYTQNFNTLKATSGTSKTLPTGWKFLETGANANTSYTTDAGSSTTGDTYSYGTGTSTERALGSLTSSSLIPSFGVQVKNSTTQTVTSINVSYTGELWRCGSTSRTDQLDFQYSLNATSLSTGTWVDANSLDFVSPTMTSTGAKDGNAAANRSFITAIISGVSIPNNAIVWLRWKDMDASGADDGLSIDDFTLQLNAVDVTAPVVSTLNPANNSTGIALNGNLTIGFNENIQKGTAGDIVIKKLTDGSAVNTTAVTAANVTISAATATIPFTALAYSTAYYVEMPAGTFKDIAGNNFAGISGSGTWSFTTQAAPAASVIVNPSSLDFGFVAAGSTSVNKTFAFTTSNLTAALTLTSPAGFELSKDGLAFGSSISYTLAEAQAGQIVTAKFIPVTANVNYSGLINFSSTGLNDNKEQLQGNSNTVTPPGLLNFYFGNMHSHSSYSDGNADNTLKIPADDYEFAKTALCFDFLGISEHNHVAAGMHLADWQPGITQATAATTSSFVAMHGMEWGVISGGGHVIVYGMDSLIGWDPGEYQVYVPKSQYTGTGGLFDVLNRHGGNALAYMAHPNSTDYNDLLNGAFDLSADNAVVGATVESGPAFSTNTSYTEPGSSMYYLSYYRNMLSKGYHLGPTIDHDNHNMTFGHTAKTRLVVLAPSLSENSLLDGMRRMRFYASQDCGARISYTVNDQPLGSILTQAGAPVISVSSITTNAVTSVKIMAGIPGSGTVATQLSSSATGNFTYTDNTLTDLSQRYYYLDITESDGTRIITAPIWFSRNDTPPLTSLTSFFPISQATDVILKWTTEDEMANQYYDVERSVNGGRTYNIIGTVAGTGSTSYAVKDISPFEGIAYYRLVQRGKDGHVSFTDIKVVDRGKQAASYYTIYPNPVHGILNVKVFSTVAETTIVTIYDMAGRLITNKQVALSAGAQSIPVDMSGLQNGTYMLSIRLAGKISTQMLNKF